MRRQSIFFSQSLENVFSVSLLVYTTLEKNTPSFFRISVHHFPHVNRPMGLELLLLEQGKHYCSALVFLCHVEENVYGENSFLREQGASSCCLPLLLALPSSSSCRGDGLVERPAPDETTNLWLLAMASSCVAKALFIVVLIHCGSSNQGKQMVSLPSS